MGGIEKGLKLAMLRVFQAAVVLMGGLLLMITGMVGVARERIDEPLRWIVVCCETNQTFVSALYIVEPSSGKYRRLTPYYDQIFLLAIHDDWFYYSGRMFTDELPSIYRVRLGHRENYLVGQAKSDPNGFSPTMKWIVFNRPDASGEQWYSISTSGGSEIPLTDVLKGQNVELQDPYFRPIFAPDDEWVIFQAADHSSGSLEIYKARLGGSELQNLTAELNSALLIGYFPKPIGLVILVTPEDRRRASLYSLDMVSYQIKSLIPIDKQVLGETVWWLGQDRLGYYAENGLIQVTEITSSAVIWEEDNVNGFWSSPDGDWALMLKYNQTVITRNGDGSQRQELTPPFDFSFPLEFSWAFERDAVYFVRSYDPSIHIGEIWRADMATGQFTRIYEFNGFIEGFWQSSDGTQLAVSATRGVQEQLFVMDSDGEDITEIPNLDPSGYVARNIVWGPTIDRPINGNALMGVGVLLCSIGAGMIYARFRKV
ncbi:MAG: hypothetical protein BroJett018_54770 [Chloroflexota bacterium]|nr:MAG: hypothetical protein BroJett018_54770 [Chloroflexota bacterium]